MLFTFLIDMSVLLTRGRAERALVPSTENLPAPVGFMESSTAAERTREADPNLIIKVSF